MSILSTLSLTRLVIEMLNSVRKFDTTEKSKGEPKQTSEDH